MSKETKVSKSKSTMRQLYPQIYAYTTPKIPDHDGWTKIGYTDRENAAVRINEQGKEADVRPQFEWAEEAKFVTDPKDWFDDHRFHTFLTNSQGIARGMHENGRPNEWFKLTPEEAHDKFNMFVNRQAVTDGTGQSSYVLRDSQVQAVDRAKTYFESGGEEFLFNAKPRFGKVLTTYKLIEEMGLRRVLIVTNRPSIANSWAEDFEKFMDSNKYSFVSANDAVKGVPSVLSRQSYLALVAKARSEATLEDMDENPDVGPVLIAFESMPALKLAEAFGGSHLDQNERYEWLKGVQFDLLVIDEAHEGTETEKAEEVFDNITRRYTLHLSGTPFKQLANQKFSDDQIFNWSYADEQEAKNSWNDGGTNYYEDMPQMRMFTYQMSEIALAKADRGVDLGDETNIDYAFDLNEFFSTKDGEFVYEKDVSRFLDALVSQEKYPFSSPELREELSHTVWYLDRVASAKALAKLLKKHEVFKDYGIVVAAGDSSVEHSEEALNEYRNKAALANVQKAIKENDKTITLTVGQLMVGTTVPEWSGILMLRNLQSPAAYIQAAFRVQTPYIEERDGIRYAKENAYVFDFDPARTLRIIDEFANRLISGKSSGEMSDDEREENIKRLLNFFPVIGEDEEGTMVELDAADVLVIPNKIISKEVVRHGFMSNFLFSNISNIFSAPPVIREIFERMNRAEKGKPASPKDLPEEVYTTNVDENGNPVAPDEKDIGLHPDTFGPAVVETIAKKTENTIEKAKEQAKTNTCKTTGLSDALKKAVKDMVNAIDEGVISKAAAALDLDSNGSIKVKKAVERKITKAFKEVQSNLEENKRKAEVDRKKAVAVAATEEDKAKAQEAFQSAIDKAEERFAEELQQVQDNIAENAVHDVTLMVTETKEQQKHKVAMDDMRERLRGFSRAIPSFLMAYGDENITIDNLVEYVNDDVFRELTGIGHDDFRLLRDGGTVTNTETGEVEEVEGGYFNKPVFNAAMQTFLAKKKELSNYFDEELKEDIYDFVPPQKTNQIFTPRWIVQHMLDLLEDENPGCFDDPNNTFADLYMKSGLFLTETIKRLYESEGLKKAYPDDKERLRHIISEQVYGLAPTEIIYNIARNYILGVAPEWLEGTTPHLACADASKAAQSNRLQELVDKIFGED